MPNPVPQHLVDAVLHRASLDREFRALLLADPRRALYESFGVTLPEGFAPRFVEKGPGLDLVAVLPDERAGSDELSDDDLERVAGGTDGDWAPPPPPPADPLAPTTP
jgi:hypothetical protein